ncbi:putative metal-dependent hydrolase family protein [Mycobacterium intracellulare MIN_052511_1280]|nr:metal-dependent hydrolase [Mycobacterium intracellulare]ETZ40639.1 putative metal-dependent hydrolase family protein [Mycobacterium intracellulare MIN_052511_1280]
MDDDIIFSHFLANLSGSFPPGEELFIRSVRRFADEIADPGLKKRVAGFIGQESVHGQQHRALNDKLVDMGYPIGWWDSEKFVDWVKRIEEVLPARIPLAVTAAAEHFTVGSRPMDDPVITARVILVEDVRDQTFSSVGSWRRVFADAISIRQKAVLRGRSNGLSSSSKLRFLMQMSTLPTIAASSSLAALSIFTLNVLLCNVGTTDISGASDGLSATTQYGLLVTVSAVALYVDRLLQRDARGAVVEGHR